MFKLLCLILVGVFSQQPNDTTTTSTTNTLRLAQVTGDNVYVRSGASTNFYAVARLPIDTQVQVADVKHGWAHIIPPAGTYSLVAKEFIDLDGEKKGVVNAERVWVHPGSELSNGPYYAKQLQLNKGASVEVLGQLGEYYRITPPTGARLWISTDYIQFVEGAVASPETTPTHATAQVDPVDAGPTSDEIKKMETVAGQVPQAPSSENISNKEFKAQIDAIESGLEKEFEKEVMQRVFVSFVQRFQPIADQDNDRPAREYARYRIEQLNKVAARIKALSEMKVLAAELEQQRESFRKERQNIRPLPMDLESRFVVRGKLIKSFVYDNPSAPKRFRLVDPDNATNRTLAYVELEPGSTIDPEKYLGRFVGVRAVSERLIEGAVEPMRVYVASELVILEQAVDESTANPQTDTTSNP